MGILRILFVIAVAWLVYYLIRQYRIKMTLLRSSSAPGSSRKMVKCAVCAVYIPLDEAVAGDGVYYCSRQHQATPAQEDS